MQHVSFRGGWLAPILLVACYFVSTSLVSFGDSTPLGLLQSRSNATTPQLSSASNSTTVPPPSSSEATSASSGTIPSATGTPQICGSRGMKECPSDQRCIVNPQKVNPGLVADFPGTCKRLDGPACGGITGAACPAPGQVCVDDPRDSCNPYFGGLDCPGVCVVF